ncbi:metal transporter [Rhizobium sp. ARZ01]|uniref:metal transporter n=1 Tax=Rhizobium sp. ARZ01 TaxID=2769313 RepID=UPI00177F625C|nr:metal transporter [Rhizobium sp. ARZ01]MBD9374885.1 metal transporter [Rhizobium sp. ARZ01]
MNEHVTIEGTRPLEIRAKRRNLLWLFAPFAVLIAVFWWLVAANPLAGFNNGAPPVENLTVERTILDHNGLRLLVRGGGSEAMNIAQVQVDAAYWQFDQTPPGPIARGSTAWISVPFPWVVGEAHKVTLVTSTGATFEHQISVAVPTPVATSGTLTSQALLGAFVGIVPIVIGLMFYPALRGAGPWMMSFLLAMTVGLLGFLFIDTIDEALEFAAQSAAIFQGSAMVFLAAAAAFLLLMAISRREGRPSGLALATYIALGIGLHNLGEGLAIGAAFAAGAAGLGTFLVMGFTLHNVTEGIAIASPILKEKPPLWRFGALALLAGGPAVVGIWLGSLTYAPHWSALALAMGAGAILQVIVEVTASMARNLEGRLTGLLTTPVMAGMGVGVAFMYATAMLVKI